MIIFKNKKICVISIHCFSYIFYFFIDLRWNNLGWKGGQLIYSALQTNQSLIKIKIQGNCIPLELTTAIGMYWYVILYVHLYILLL